MDVAWARFPEGPRAPEPYSNTSTRYRVSSSVLAPDGILFDFMKQFYGVNSTTFSRNPKGRVLDNISTLSNAPPALHFLQRDESSQSPHPERPLLQIPCPHSLPKLPWVTRIATRCPTGCVHFHNLWQRSYGTEIHRFRIRARIPKSETRCARPRYGVLSRQGREEMFHMH